MELHLSSRILKKTLAFTGIKHSGKSTFGKITAAKFGVSFADSDDLLLNQYNERNPSPFSSVRDLYREKGKGLFMEYEYLGIKHYFDNLHSSGVLSLGGGIIDNDNAVSLLMDKSVLVYLDVPEETLYSRVASKGIPPFLDSADPRGSFTKMVESRRKRYLDIAGIVLRLGNKSITESEEYIIDRLLEEDDVWQQHR